jgi:predicted nuclease with TOPRIM domain
LREEEVIKEYWRLLLADSQGDKADEQGGRNRLERLASVAQKLENRRRRIVGEISVGPDRLPNQYEKLFKNLETPMFSELDDLKEEIFLLRDQVDERKTRTERLIAESQDILLKTSISKKRDPVGNRHILKGELVC